MDYSTEEQQMEVEALKSIYGEQFTTGGGSADNQPVFYEVKVEQENTKISLIFTIPGINLHFVISLLKLYNSSFHTQQYWINLLNFLSQIISKS